LHKLGRQGSPKERPWSPLVEICRQGKFSMLRSTKRCITGLNQSSGRGNMCLNMSSTHPKGAVWSAITGKQKRTMRKGLLGVYVGSIIKHKRRMKWIVTVPSATCPSRPNKGFALILCFVVTPGSFIMPPLVFLDT
jgi:hypothetical protein